MSLRTPLIAGNWKMNKTATEGVELAKAVAAAMLAQMMAIEPNISDRPNPIKLQDMTITCF